MALDYGRSRAKANRVFPRECTGDSKHPLPTTEQKTVHKLTKKQKISAVNVVEKVDSSTVLVGM